MVKTNGKKLTSLRKHPSVNKKKVLHGKQLNRLAMQIS